MTTHDTDSAPEYDWSDRSALWQVEHGEAGTDRTASAFTHLEVSINGGDLDTVRSVALQLLGVVEHFNEAQNDRSETSNE